MKYSVTLFIFFFLLVSSCVFDDAEEITIVKVHNRTYEVITIDTGILGIGVRHRTIDIDENVTILVKIKHWVTAKGRDSGKIYDRRYFPWQTPYLVPWIIKD